MSMENLNKTIAKYKVTSIGAEVVTLVDHLGQEMKVYVGDVIDVKHRVHVHDSTTKQAKVLLEGLKKLGFETEVRG